MRVAMFADCFHPVINGVSTSVEVLAGALESAGHQVLLAVPSAAGAPLSSAGRLRFRSHPFPFQPEDRFSYPLPLAHLRRLHAFQPEVVHLHTPFNLGLVGWSYATWAGIPRVFTHHTLWEEYVHYLPVLPPWLLRPVAVGLCRWFCNTSGAAIAPSEEVRLRQRQQGIRVPIHVIPTGIEVAEFSGGDPERVRSELGLGGEERVVLSVGRLAREKSLAFLLESFALLARAEASAQLVVVGDGPERGPLEALARILGVADRVRFLGYRPRQALRHYLAAASVFAFASQTETQGLVLLEAQAAGVPVVGVRASGTSEAVRDDHGGLLVEPGDQAGFVEALRRILADPPLRERLARGAREQALAFSTGSMAERVVSVYRALSAPSAAAG